MATRTRVTHRLENRRGEQLYFCEIVVDGRKLTGTTGTTHTVTGHTEIRERFGQRFPTDEAAAAGVARVLERRGRHYKERRATEEQVTGTPASLAPAASNPALEAEVRAGDAVGAATVYADWLQTQGDVRGELAALWLAGQDDQARAWLAANPTRLFGELDVQLDSEIYDLVWRHGFVVGASLKRAGYDSQTDLGALTRAFLELPVSRLVSQLRFGLARYESDNDWSGTLRAVTEAPHAAWMRTLAFDDYEGEDCELSWTPFGDFSFAWPALPQLEILRLKSGAGGELGALDLPNLRELTRISGGLGEGELRSIIDAKLPRLEHLEVWFGDDNYGAAGTPEHVAELLARAPATLRHLGLVNCAFTHEVLERLAASPVLARLTSLDLSKGALLDGDVDLLLRHADAFAHLERLDLSANLLDERRGEITAALPRALVDDQRYEGEDDRFVAVGE